MAEHLYPIKTNLDEVDIQSIKDRLGAAMANYIMGQILELSKDIQKPVYDAIIEERLRKRDMQ